jgi:hypothetical protein
MSCGVSWETEERPVRVLLTERSFIPPREAHTRGLGQGLRNSSWAGGRHRPAVGPTDQRFIFSKFYVLELNTILIFGLYNYGICKQR